MTKVYGVAVINNSKFEIRAVDGDKYECSKINPNNGEVRKNGKWYWFNKEKVEVLVLNKIAAKEDK